MMIMASIKGSSMVLRCCGVGSCASLSRNGRFIYVLVTKEKYWQKPSYGNLAGSLLGCVGKCVKDGVTHLCMPKIGCGLDKLKWNKVEEIIKEIFGETNIRVSVYQL